MASRNRALARRQMLLYAAVGALEWLILVMFPARHNANFLGGSYFVALFVSAFILGAADMTKSNLAVAYILIAPGLLLAGWTAPRGDNNGLWILWFPFLVVAVLPTAGCHWLGRLVRKTIAA